MQQGQDTKQKGIEPNDVLTIVYNLASALSVSILPFIRTGFGREALGYAGLWALGLMLFWAAINSSGAMFIYVGLWIIAVIVQREKTMRMLAEGARIHSRYDGWPWLALHFTRKEKFAMGFVEPLICIGAGMLICLVSQVVGAYMVASMVGLGVRKVIEGEISKRRVQSMVDSEIEAKWYSDQLRKKGGW